MTRPILACCAFMLALAASACGPTSAEPQAVVGPTPLSFAEGKINSANLKVFLAPTYIERARSEISIDLSGKKDQNAVIWVFGKDKDAEEELVLYPDFSAPADLVFANASGEVVAAFTGATSYVPNGHLNPSTMNSNAPNFYRSGKPASVAAFMPVGTAEKAGLAVGAKLSASPDPFAAIANADPAKVRLSFRPKTHRDPERTPAPAIHHLNVRIAMTADDRARGLRDGEDALLLLYPSQEDLWQRDGVWLKGVKGKVSIGFLRLQQANAGRSSSSGGKLTGFGAMSSISEGCEDSGSDDLDRPIWYPVRKRVEATDTSSMSDQSSSSVAGPVNAVLLIRGEGAFKGRNITDEMWFTTTAFVMQNPERWSGAGNLVESHKITEAVARVGNRDLRLRLATGNDSVVAAISSHGSVRGDEAVLLAWDSPTTAMAANAGRAEAKVALLTAEGGNRFKVGEVRSIGASSPLAAMAGLQSRFALLTEKPLSAGEAVTLPWRVADLRPTLRRGAFYSAAKKPEVHQSTWPEGSKQKIHLEVAQTDSAITRGLMGRTSLAPNHGMLFVFADSSRHSFWMKNCLMDIDVAFVDADFKVVTIHEMKKEDPSTSDWDLKLYPSNLPVKYAVEMEGGWFAKNGVKVGDRLWLPAPLSDRLAE